MSATTDKRTRDPLSPFDFDPSKLPRINSPRGGRFGGRNVTSIRTPLIVSKYEFKDGDYIQATFLRDQTLVKISQLFISKDAFDIALLAEGNFHKIYEFVGDGEITIKFLNKQKEEQSVTLQKSEIILRCIKSMKPDQMRAVHERDLKARVHLEKEKVPFPHAHIRPDDFEDLDAESNKKYGDFWIETKMDTHVDLEDATLKEFIREQLTKMAVEKKTIIYDFYPRNVMAKGGIWHVVDPDLDDSDGDDQLTDTIDHLDNADYLIKLFKYLVAWSAGKQENYDFYTANFPVEVLKQIDARLSHAKEAHKGTFPTTHQTTHGCKK
jgi:hypothetical protein